MKPHLGLRLSPRPDRSGHEGEKAAVAVHTDDVADSDDRPVDLETFAHDRITAVIQEEFAGHRMQDLVAAVLRCQGFTCRISPEGTDGGIDILAGSGPLGLDEPRLVVQVKSEQSAVGDPVVTQLLGSVSKHSPAQGLLVAWGGVTAPARKTVLDNYFRVRSLGLGGLARPDPRVLPETARRGPRRSASEADLDRR